MTMAEHPAGGNRVRGPLNAAGLRALDGVFDRTLGRQKRRLFDELPDEVVELGSGVGANLRYLRAGTRLTAIEPNPAMHPRLRQAAAEAGVTLHLLPSGAETIPLPDASTDAVICTLVLCTVGDPDAVLAEVRRILRPGGRFLFVEHVVADPTTHRILAAIQGLVHRPWRWLFEGCDVRRDTAGRIQAAGFASVDLQAGMAQPAVLPVAPMVWGAAVA
jgi:SAM-dependent methyltransferase